MANSDQMKPSGLERPQFIDRHGLWTNAQKEHVRWIKETIARDEITSVRLVYCDQHGIARGKTLTARYFLSALERGYAITSALFAFDTANEIVFPVFSGDGGLPFAEAGGTGDLIMVPGPVDVPRFAMG